MARRSPGSAMAMVAMAAPQTLNNRGGRGNAQQGAAEQKTGRKAKRQSQQPQKAVVTDEDVQRQVKETLAPSDG